MSEVVKQFVAEVNGRQRQCLVTLPADKAGDLNEAWGLIVETDKYWDTFYDGAEDEDWTAPVENPRLLKVRT